MRKAVVHGPTIAIITLIVSFGLYLYVDKPHNETKFEKIKIKEYKK